MQAVPLIIMAAGTAASMAADRNANKERRGILNSALQKTEDTQQNATKQVLAEGQNYGADRQQALADQQQSAIAQALKDVGGSAENGAGAQVIDTAGGQGVVSDDFVKAKADKAIDEGNRMTAVARELAKVRAPGQLLTSDAQRRASLVSDLGSLATTNRNDSNAASLDAQNVQAPWWGTLGKVAQMAGSAMAGSGFGAAAGAGGSSVGSLGAGGAEFGSMSSQPSFWNSAGSRIRFGPTG